MHKAPTPGGELKIKNSKFKIKAPTGSPKGEGRKSRNNAKCLNSNII